MPEFLENDCNFQTERLNIVGYISHINNQANKDNLTNQVIEIMSPKVTESLPSGWQNINTTTVAEKWLNEINLECSFLLVQLKNTNEVIGFIFLYEPDDIKLPIDIRLGYLLGEKHWGSGLGSELIKGLLICCKSSEAINSITGGVEADNIGSIKVLEKNGFIQTESNNEGVLFYVYDFHQH